ncbi:hypothetical protein [Photobacterium leiognathi]|uniref:hypothetical protein n=1 Tax=Photobacterium leiognathi TaxID=553611 RepID=UPI002980E091|nr:hypothetical protein [Photobacterium leiognathi]
MEKIYNGEVAEEYVVNEFFRRHGFDDDLDTMSIKRLDCLLSQIKEALFFHNRVQLKDHIHSSMNKDGAVQFQDLNGNSDLLYCVFYSKKHAGGYCLQTVSKTYAVLSDMELGDLDGIVKEVESLNCLKPVKGVYEQWESTNIFQERMEQTCRVEKFKPNSLDTGESLVRS